jgi:hypothetical protein
MANFARWVEESPVGENSPEGRAIQNKKMMSNASVNWLLRVPSL